MGLASVLREARVPLKTGWVCSPQLTTVYREHICVTEQSGTPFLTKPCPLEKGSNRLWEGRREGKKSAEVLSPGCSWSWLGNVGKHPTLPQPDPGQSVWSFGGGAWAWHFAQGLFPETDPPTLRSAGHAIQRGERVLEYPALSSLPNASSTCARPESRAKD